MILYQTRYWLLGPENGKKVTPSPSPFPPHSSPSQIVLIHGLSIPSLVYKDVAPHLSKGGYRVLLYDLYGRGYSDAPAHPTVYDTALYATQLALLMQHVGWEKAALVGVSMVSLLHVRLIHRT